MVSRLEYLMPQSVLQEYNGCYSLDTEAFASLTASFDEKLEALIALSSKTNLNDTGFLIFLLIQNSQYFELLREYREFIENLPFAATF